MIDYILQIIKNRTALFLFLLFFIIYNLNMRTIPPSDSISTSLMPFSILENHNLSLDQFANYFITIKPYPWMVFFVGGHYYSSYPIVLPVLITPLYIFPYIFLKMVHCPIDALNPGFQLAVLIMEKFCSSLIASGAGAFLYLALGEIIAKKAAVITSIIFAIGASTWATSSQNLWQHGLIELFLSILIFMVIKSGGHISIRNAVIMGIISGLFVFNRPADALLLLSVIFYVIRSKDNMIYYFASAALSGLPFLIYNIYYFGKIFFIPYSYLDQSMSIDNLINIFGLLISPSRGILVYSPIVVLAIFGYIEAMKIDDENLRYFFIAAGLSVIFEMLVYGSFSIWYAGGSYGPRFLTGLLPILGIFIGFYLNKLNKNDTKILFIISLLLVWSVFVQVVGAFYAPHGWYCCTPTNIADNPGRLWDWGDMEIFRDFNAGPYPTDPMAAASIILKSILKLL